MCSHTAALTVNEKLVGLSSSSCQASEEDMKCTKTDKESKDRYLQFTQL